MKVTQIQVSIWHPRNTFIIIKVIIIIIIKNNDMFDQYCMNCVFCNTIDPKAQFLMYFLFWFW